MWQAASFCEAWIVPCANRRVPKMSQVLWLGLPLPGALVGIAGQLWLTNTAGNGCQGWIQCIQTAGPPLMLRSVTAVTSASTLGCRQGDTTELASTSAHDVRVRGCSMLVIWMQRTA